MAAFFTRGNFMGKKINLYVKLFMTMFTISAVTFGGGYVIVSIMKKKFVDELGWLEENEMIEMTALAQSCPGVIAVNTAILVGYRAAGAPGAFLTVLGAVLPPFFALSIVSVFYQAFRDQYYIGLTLKGMQAGVAALLCDVVYTMSRKVAKEKKPIPCVIMIVSFATIYFFKINVVFILLACGLIGYLTGARTEEKP
jgi:chromate transporter